MIKYGWHATSIKGKKAQAYKENLSKADIDMLLALQEG